MAETSANIGEAIVDHTVGGSVGGAGFDSAGRPVDPWWLQMLSAMPGAATTMGATAYRGANTITGGGWADRRWSREFGMQQRPNARGAGIRNNNPFNPRTWMRYGSQDIFNDGNDSYSPFQFISRSTNWLANKDPGGIISKTTNRLGLGDSGDLVTKGGFARATAGSRVANMSERRYARTMGTAEAPGASRRYLNSAGYTNEMLEGMDQRGVSQAMRMSGTGRINAAVGGFMEGINGGFTREVGDAIDDDILAGGKRQAAGFVKRRFEGIGKDWTNRAAQKAGVELGETGLEGLGRAELRRVAMRGGTRGAAVVGARVGFKVATRAIPIVGQVMLAHDIAKVTALGAGAAVKGSVKMANEGMISMRGGMRVGVMDQGFRDNSVSISSRARGVSAIQNSRLNARSVLGTEGSAMHAHFG